MTLSRWRTRLKAEAKFEKELAERPGAMPAAPVKQ
jgi:hypothetical protein